MSGSKDEQKPPTPGSPRDEESAVPGMDLAEIAPLIRAASLGDKEALGRLRPLIDPIARDLVRRHKRELPGVDVKTTQLVDDALLNVIGRGIPWEREDLKLFYGLLARKVHDLLVDELRRMERQKHDPGGPVLPIDSVDVPSGRASLSDQIGFFIDLREMLDRLQRALGEAAVVFKLKILLGCTFEEIAFLLGKNKAAVFIQYEEAKEWLKEKELKDGYEWAIGLF